MKDPFSKGWSLQAANLIEEVESMSYGDYDPCLVVESFREQEQHMVADLLEGLHDYIYELGGFEIVDE